MKKRIFALLLLLALAIGLLLWWRARESGRTADAAVQHPQDSSAIAQQAPVAKEVISSEDLARTPWKGPDEFKRRMIATVRDSARQANQPIEFYGKVIDQDGNPIPGVKVKLGVRWTQELPLPGTSKDTFNYFDLVSDSQGLFKLTDTKGALLAVKTLEKDGYETAASATRQSYWYWASGLPEKYTPDSHRPEIFHMWKMRGAEYLLEKNRTLNVPADGAPISIDLHTGERVGSGGDLRVTMIRTPQQIEHDQKDFEWTVAASIEGGGIIETNAEQPYYAPESGYEPTFEVHMPVNDPHWVAYTTRGFFIKLKDGNYGRITVNFYPGFYEPGVSFHAFINPSGSRNLEYNSLQNVVLPSVKTH